ncbi:hypothetical protein [Actinokineospora bangkokensis]|uniref:Uncharacterized protein n=1 Tax=Actinokineospora bangkokensis TaxID=1193682 RepID=A0A1Q9LK37_9PSEU|nr:hypothetical protein [Actinokineospora bangkokensis]OLR92417.1 hypothetical protein BJP25_20230 [Actinokineospora bangkokensis]
MAQQVKVLLRGSELDEVRQLRETRISVLLGGGSGWLEESDSALERDFGGRLSSGQSDELSTLVGRATDDDGVKQVVVWFNGVLDGWATTKPGPRFSGVAQVPGYADWWQGLDSTDSAWKYVRSDTAPTDATPGWVDQATAYAAMAQPAAARFSGVVPVNGHPGWWQGLDGTDSAWKYVRSDTAPTDATPGWVDQATAFATMAAPQAPAAPRFSGIAQVQGYPGWWQGLDSTDSAWKYVRSDTQPTDATPGWVDQATAFATMAQPAAATAAPATAATEDAEPAEPVVPEEDIAAFVESVVGPSLTDALGEVDGVEELSAEDVYDALNEALHQLTLNA